MSLTANEQYLLELINRARLDPQGEATRLGIPLNTGLTAGTISGTPVRVLAPNENLNDSAQTHGEWMLDTDTFSHTGSGGSTPGARMATSGYAFTGSWAWRENLSWIGTTGTLDAETAIEQQYYNLYASSGHRVNTFADNVREIGLAQVLGKFKSGAYDFNASMVVENFAKAGTTIFVTGVAYTDVDANAFYGIGEGLEGLTFKVGTTQDISEGAGGYSIGIAPATETKVSVSFGKQSLGSIALDTSGGNVKLDMILQDGSWMAAVSSSATLKAGMANARLLGISNWSLTGNQLDNHLIGNSGSNYLRGGTGNDTLDGGAGADTLSGSDGDDTYIVDNVLDVITGEFIDSGYDSVISSVSYTLRPNFEKLTLTGTGNLNATGNSGNNLLTGNSGNNLLTGGAGDDTLDGGTGADTMSGSTGNDTYIVDNALDCIKGEFTDSGIDSVIASVSFKLAPNLENLTLTGTADLTGTGNARDNLIVGNAGANLLSGDAGNDRLSGGDGADTLVGGAGADTLNGGDGADVFMFKKAAESPLAGFDLIEDFTVDADLIDLTAIDANSSLAGNQEFSFIGEADFGGLGAGSSGQLRFEASGDDLLVQMDLDGDGLADMQLLLLGHSSIGASDFLL